MKPLRTMAAAAMAVAITVAMAACGDDGGNPTGDAGPDAATDAGPDAPPATTFTSYVIDLIQNQTSNQGEARPFDEFSGLPDPDLDNPAAYESLFP